MKLFAIKNTNTNRIVPDTFFSDKMLAKKARNSISEQTGQAHVITYGPDHKLFKAKG